MSNPVLRVEDLHIRIGKGVNVVRGLSFDVSEGETVCIVGESGCGKSVSALSILRLLPPIINVNQGRILLDGRDLLEMSEADMRRVRGNEIAMIFQEPMSSLNPLRTIGFQIAEVLMLHKGMSRAAARDRVIELLETVQIPDAASRFDEYPHQLSGGMRQRVMISMALACQPRVILADEPTTALDVTIQAQITSLLRDLREKFGTAIVLITHDMGLVAENADRVVVMYAGHKVEEASVQEFFERPTHPYSRGLLGSLPRLGQSLGEDKNKLREIPGTVPPFDELPAGCPFVGRCAYADQLCAVQMPPFERQAADHVCACWHPQGAKGVVR
ncbi:ABC transporter ATP-binding protein [Limibacillus halophilus]|uniref:Oligopeptide/dipeptide ABC transporter ATP-binding protein n=1 Tax=Limibacillus halophilus TaxID=1579333 RepID=A0A839SRV7_9PROT|nr:ABC transporter ATP-binding protein [Limibacillus halophilus]MBB3064524.1 oligopeptide/dipeptide ABC transporter ATP-binding protein [Limibacillus halophilus]